MKTKIYSKKTHWVTRALTYIVTFALTFQSVPASAFFKNLLFATTPYELPEPTAFEPTIITTDESYRVLSDSFIQDELNGNPVLELNDDEVFSVPYYIDHNVPSASHIDTFAQRLHNTPIRGLGAHIYIPIDVSGITIFIPGREQITYFNDAGQPAVFGTEAAQALYITHQTYGLLGRTLIDTNRAAYASEEAQLNTLYNNAYSFILSRPNVFYGQKLNLDRFNSGLAYDMVWPEIRRINGKTVVVPIVYLSKATVDARRVDSNTTEINGNVSLNALTIDGVDIRFGRETFLNVANNLLNNQGSIVSEGDLEIVAGGYLKNISGLIQAQGDLRIGAHSIESKTLIHRFNEYSQSREVQGTRYGEVSAINALTGDLVLRSYSDITFVGTTASSGGELTLAADGNIYLGSERVETTTSSADYNASTISYLQSGLTAEDTLRLIANGQIVIDAAEIVSERGHIELLAGLGITIEDDLSMRQFARTFSGGQESSYKTIAMRALLDAGKGIRIHSEFGDITLRATDITSTQGTSVTASNGGVNLLMTVENDHYRYNYTKKGLFTTKTINRGHDIETGVPNSIVGGFVIESLKGVTVEYEGDPSLSLDEQVAVLSQFEGLEWMADVRANHPDADWQAIELQYEEWNITKRSLSPAFMAIIAIVVAMYAGPAFANALGASAGTAATATAAAIPATSATVLGSATLGAATVAAATSLATAVTLAAGNAAVNGDNPIDASFEVLTDDEALKSAAIAAITAGAINALDADFFNATGDTPFDVYVDTATRKATLSLAGQATQAVTYATVQAGVRNIIFRGNSDSFEDGFIQALAQNGVNRLGKRLTQQIGQAAKGDPLLNIAPDITTSTQYIAHAAVGCLTGGLTSRLGDGETELGCVSGAGGAVLGEYIGQQYEDDLENDLKQWIDEQVSDGNQPTRQQIIDQGLIFKQSGVDMARLASGLTAFAVGGDVNIASASSANVAENNALFTTIVIISTLAYTSYVSYQEGGLYEGLQSMGRGDDPLSEALASVTEAGVELLVSEFPVAAEETAIVLSAVGDTISAGVTVVLETSTGETVTRYWNEIPEDKRNALVGAGKVVSIVVPASFIAKVKTLNSIDVELGDWVQDPYHPNWDKVDKSKYEQLNDKSAGASEWGLIPNVTRLPDGQEINLHLDYAKREHVLYGDSNARGGHSTNSNNVVTTGNVETASNGVRYAQVKINDTLKSNNSGFSTLFPESWTDADIMREFSEGLASGSVQGNGGYITTTPSGVRIQYYLGKNKVKTFYPIFE